MTDEFSKDLCEQKHVELDRRVCVIEKSLQENMQRMYTKLDTETLNWAKKATENAKRPSYPVLVMMSFMAGIIGVLIALALK